MAYITIIYCFVNKSVCFKVRLGSVGFECRTTFARIYVFNANVTTTIMILYSLNQVASKGITLVLAYTVNFDHFSFGRCDH